MYKTGLQRNQIALFPTYLEDLVEQDSIVRVIDAFVDSLELSRFDFKYSTPTKKGNRPYNPKDLLKLYLFGYNQKIRSSRKLMYQAKNNIECIWLLNSLTPDFRTISDFRKDNAKNLKKIFYEFNLSCKELDILSSVMSQDGTKIKAVNSKDNNFTLNKIDDRKKRIEEHIDSYLSFMDLNDEVESKENYIKDVDKLKNLLNNLDSIILNDPSKDKESLINELKHYIDKLEYYNSLEQTIISNNANQISLIDPEAKLMRDNGKFTVGYNNQVCVDSNHLVVDFEITDKPADLGTITDISSNIKKIYDFDTVTNITDKGYADRSDMMNALENGIIPEVTPMTKNQDGFELETDYVENEITDKMINSTKPSDIQKCLKAGVIPNVYKDNIKSIEVKDVAVFENVDNDETCNLSELELRDKSINDYCFTRHLPTDKVFCPMGEILRKKSKNKNGIRYCNKLACKNCKNPCCSSQYKTVEFKDNKVLIIPKNSNITTPQKRAKKRTKKIVKKVLITTKTNYDLINKRMTLSEHPHAQLKFWDDSKYLLLRGKEKATGEMALYYCAYNIRRAINILGSETLIAYFRNKYKDLSKNNLNNSHFLSYFFNLFFFAIFFLFFNLF